MLCRLPVVLGLVSLMLPALVFCGCSSSQKRDQNYGTDAGLDFQIPDAAGFSSQTTGDAGTADVVPAGDAGTADVVPAGDAGTADVVATGDAGIAGVAPDTGLEDLLADAPAQESGPGIDS